MPSENSVGFPHVFLHNVTIYLNIIGLDRLNDDISSVSSDNQITKMKSDLQEMQEELELSKNHNRDLECALAGSVGKTETTLQATAVLKVHSCMCRNASVLNFYSHM